MGCLLGIVFESNGLFLPLNNMMTNVPVDRGICSMQMDSLPSDGQKPSHTITDHEIQINPAIQVCGTNTEILRTSESTRDQQNNKNVQGIYTS